jgi:hypothetical protein
MRLQRWFVVVAALAATGALHAQQKIGLSIGLGTEWTAIPGRPDAPGLAQGMWGGSATLYLCSVSIPRFAVVARLQYAPDRVAPAAPRMLSIGGGVRYTLATTRRLSLRPSLELEAVRFTAVDAYNAVLSPFVCPSGGACLFIDPLTHYGEGLLIEEGWRLGLRLHPTLQIWPMERVGLELTPAVRWLLPVSRSLPSGGHDRYTDPLYVTLGVGVVFRFGPAL